MTSFDNFRKTSVMAAVMAASGLFSGASQADDLYIAVAANFADAVAALATGYARWPSALFPFGTITPTSGSTGSFYTSLNSQLNQTPPTASYDLFFGANYSYPELLYTNHTSQVSSPVFYAEGFLALWSPFGPAVDGSGSYAAGFPPPGTSTTSTTFNYANSQVAIADPVNAPYGTAATQYLLRVDGVQYPHVTGSAYTNWDAIFDQFSTIGTTYTAVNTSTSTGNANIGFIALSQICNPATGTVRTTNIGGTHYVIPQSSATYDRILQYVDKISVGPGTSGFAQDFLDYVASSAGKAVIQKYCYNNTL